MTSHPLRSHCDPAVIALAIPPFSCSDVPPAQARNIERRLTDDEPPPRAACETEPGARP
jgi:hypothetical protein